MSFKAGDTIIAMSQSSSQKKRNETDRVIMFLTSPERGFMLIIYGYEPNGSIYNPDRIIDDNYSPINSMTLNEHRYILKRVLKDKISRWD